MEKKIITDTMVDELRLAVKPYMKEKRYSHTLAVEKEAAFLGRIFLPEKLNALRCSALLHDITKKLDTDEQESVCRELSVPADDELHSSPSLYHAVTGAALAKRDFPEYADDEIISGIRWHTTGRAGMTMFESIIYLADYIEETRTFETCVELRKFFYESIAQAKNDKEKYTAFLKTMVMSFDMTVKGLLEEGRPVDRNTVEARECFAAALGEWSRKNEPI